MEEPKKLTEEEEKIFGSALTLPEEMAEATDFVAEEAIKLDTSIKLPESFSLGKWIYKTSYQGTLGACTSLGTTHGVQILTVKKKGVEPKNSNIVTPKWKDLWAKMGHSTTEYDGGDYVERAVNIALKEGIVSEEDGSLIKFDGYATQDWESNDKGVELIKRYLYNGNPIVWLIKGNSTTWNEMTRGEVKTIIPSSTGGHCIALVGWDNDGFWFINSWSPNDGRGLKSRFHITYDVMKKLGRRLNHRYWILYNKADAKVDPEYLKRKNIMKVIIEALKKQYNNEPKEMQQAIVNFSQVARKLYPEINKELPL